MKKKDIFDIGMTAAVGSIGIGIINESSAPANIKNPISGLLAVGILSRTAKKLK